VSRPAWCLSSQWFACPCHGSKYNAVGEKRDGPAPRGLDRFTLTVSGGGEVTIDTGTIVTGPPIGTNTTKQGQEGPACV
jgi:cytochrome b6-f complex iron-sulfur subunit